MATDLNDNEGFWVRARGLPFNAGAAEVVEFFKGIEVCGGVEGVRFVHERGGRPSGECFVHVRTEEDEIKALDRHKSHMDHRYIEVYRAAKAEVDKKARRKSIGGSGDHVVRRDAFIVRLRGLPFGCSKEEITGFMDGIKIVPNGITLLLDHNGKCNGEGFVEFSSKADLEQAIKLDRQMIGKRYIEIFSSSDQELRLSVKRSSASHRSLRSVEARPLMPEGYEFGRRYEEPHASEQRIHMRGLPFSATEQQIEEFFAPLRPTSIELCYRGGRVNGEANVYFATMDEINKAMRRDRELMGHRYIELFLDAVPQGSWEGRPGPGPDYFDDRGPRRGHSPGYGYRDDSYRDDFRRADFREDIRDDYRRDNYGKPDPRESFGARSRPYERRPLDYPGDRAWRDDRHGAPSQPAYDRPSPGGYSERPGPSAVRHDDNVSARPVAYPSPYGGGSGSGSYPGGSGSSAYGSSGPHRYEGSSAGSGGPGYGGSSGGGPPGYGGGREAPNYGGGREGPGYGRDASGYSGGRDAPGYGAGGHPGYNNGGGREAVGYGGSGGHGPPAYGGGGSGAPTYGGGGSGAPGFGNAGNRSSGYGGSSGESSGYGSSSGGPGGYGTGRGPEDNRSYASRPDYSTAYPGTYDRRQPDYGARNAAPTSYPPSAVMGGRGANHGPY